MSMVFEIGFGYVADFVYEALSALLYLFHSITSDVLEHGLSAQIETQQRGSVGTLIGASLETAGHFMQSSFLDMMDTGAHGLGFGNAFGALIFAIAAMSAIFIIGVGGNYKFGLWFFIGPSLFWWMVQARTPSYGVSWEFGTKGYPSEQIFRATAGVLVDGEYAEQGAINPPPSPAQVSWFFAQYTQLVSGIVDGMVEVFEVVGKNLDQQFVGKADRYMALFAAGVTDPEMKFYINIIAVNKCADYYSLTRYLNSPHVSAPYKDIIRDRLAVEGEVVVHAHSEIVGFDNWLTDHGLESVKQTDGTYTCNELWNVAVEAIKQNAWQVLQKVATVNPPRGLTGDPTALEEWRERQLNLLADRFGCTWDKKDKTFDCSAISPDDYDKKVVAMVNEISARMLLREMKEMKPALAQMEFDKIPSEQQGDTRTWHDMDFRNAETARSIRELSSTEEFKGKGDFLGAMLALPYIQGLVLYFLALLFPFFAMALIIPGRHNAFLMWMGLWFWIKSWDIGFAVVMIIDEVLYVLMPHGPPLVDDLKTSGGDPAAKVDHIGSVMKSMFEVDPSYSVHTYYNLIATCLAAVPALTGLLVKKGGHSLNHAINQGFQNFTGRIGNAFASYSRSLQAQSKLGDIQSRTYNAVNSQMLDSILQKDVAPNLLSSAALKQAQNLQKALRANPNNKQAQNQLGKFMQDTMHGIGAVTADQSSRIALASFVRNQRRVAHARSIDWEARRDVADAQLQKYYMHGNTYDIHKVLDAEFKVLQHRRDMRIGGAVARSVNNLHQTLKGANGSSKFLTSAPGEAAQAARSGWGFLQQGSQVVGRAVGR